MSAEPTQLKHLYTEAEAAQYLGIALITLRRWRAMGQGPAYYRVGKIIRYRAPSLDRFIEQHEVQPIKTKEIKHAEGRNRRIPA